MAQIINQPLGRSPPSGQAPSPQRKQNQHTQGARGCVNRGRCGNVKGGGGREGTGGRGIRNSPQRKQDERHDCQETYKSGNETEANEDKRDYKEGERGGEAPRGAPVEEVCMGGGVSPPEGNTELLDFIPERAYPLLQEVYGDFPYQNNGSYMDEGVPDDNI